ncbi:hypothetical protein MHK_005540, partial [Candidatus Magnetomorum sp. HK-1]
TYQKNGNCLSEKWKHKLVFHNYSAEVAKKIAHGRLEILDIQKEMIYII